MATWLVKKSFPYSEDGVRVCSMVAGDVFDCRAELAPGLEREGFIGTPIETGAPVHIGSGTVDTEANTGTGDGDGDGQATVLPLEAVHRGGGTYAVVNGDDVVVSGLSKESAAAFNDMDDAGKQAFIDAGSSE